MLAFLLNTSTRKIDAFSPSFNPNQPSPSTPSALFCVESTATRHNKETLRIRGSLSFVGTAARHSNIRYNGGTRGTAPQKKVSTKPRQGWISALKTLESTLKSSSLLTVGLQVLVATVFMWKTIGGTSSLWFALDRMQLGVLWYGERLDANPVVTKSVTAAVVGVVGDFLAQRLERGPKKLETPASSSLVHAKTMHANLNWFSQSRRYNTRRGLSVFADGLFLSGPLMHFGYELFERLMPISGEGSMIAALGHVLADTLVLDSVFVGITFWVTGCFEGYSMRQVLHQFRKDYIPALKAGGLTSVLVLPIELVCFRYLPLSFRVLAVNMVDIVWDAVISHAAHRSRGYDNQERQELVKMEMQQKR